MLNKKIEESLVKDFPNEWVLAEVISYAKNGYKIKKLKVLAHSSSKSKLLRTLSKYKTKKLHLQYISGRISNSSHNIFYI